MELQAERIKRKETSKTATDHGCVLPRGTKTLPTTLPARRKRAYYRALIAKKPWALNYSNQIEFFTKISLEFNKR